MSGMTHVRYRVVAFAVALAMVTYLDRVCISMMAPSIMRDTGIGMREMSYVFSAFTLAYGIFEIPTAWWADRSGTRIVLTRIVTWWSCFTMATAGAFSYRTLLAVRFLFGIGEAGAWPCVARTFSRWIPVSERGTMQGVFFMGAHLSGGLTPILVTLLMHYLQWRQIFLMFGLVGFAWALAWHRWFRDDPREHPEVSPDEATLIEHGRAVDVPSHGIEYWEKLFSNRNILPLCVMYFANTWCFYFCITWFPTYLTQARGFDSMKLGIMAGLPLVASTVGDLFGGIVTDRVSKRYGLWMGRSGVGAAGYAVAMVAMFLGAMVEDPMIAGILIAVAVAACMFTLGAAWGVCIDIGGNHSGVVSAAMNTAGQVGGFLCPIVVTGIVERYHLWSAPIYLMAGLFLLGTIAWLTLDPRERVFAA
jgi:ACS family glucarate transporter-like MFS transporter